VGLLERKAGALRKSLLKQVLKEAQTIWRRVRVRWYNGRRRELDVTRGTAVWYRIGQPAASDCATVY
jgi:hypothetical protein